MVTAWTPRQKHLMSLVDAYNRTLPVGYIPPLIAKANGTLHIVAEQIDVPLEELDSFLTMVNAELPPVD
ncbi:MAG: hypothetical protein WCT41_01695 [Candidatus Paceibacterota bacterium]